MRLTGKLLKDEYGYGHIRLHGNGVRWSNSYLSVTEAANAAFGLDLIEQVEMDTFLVEARAFADSVAIDADVDTDALSAAYFTAVGTL